MKREYKYHEGPDAAGKFERAMVALFKAPKTAPKKKAARPKRKTSRKSENADRD
jgi:hypothetical protein